MNKYLIKLSDYLYTKGFYEEASNINLLIKKISAPRPPRGDSYPTPEEEKEMREERRKRKEEEALLNCEKFIKLYEKYKRLSDKAPAPMPAPRPPRGDSYPTPEEEKKMIAKEKEEEKKKEEGIFKEYFKYLDGDYYFMKYMNCKFGFTDKEDYVCNLPEFKYMKNKKGYPSICSSKIYDIKFEYENLEDLDKKRLKEIIEKGNY